MSLVSGAPSISVKSCCLPMWICSPSIRALTPRPVMLVTAPAVEQGCAVQPGAGRRHDGGGQRVVALGLDGEGDVEQFGFLDAVCGFDVGHFGFALGEGAGFVEGDRAQGAEVFQRAAALDEQAAAGGAGQTGQDRARGGDGQGAGAGGDQDGQGPVERGGEGFVDDEAGEEQHDDEDQHGGDEHALEPVGEALRRGGLGLGFADHPHDPGERGVLGQPGHLRSPALRVR